MSRSVRNISALRPAPSPVARDAAALGSFQSCTRRCAMGCVYTSLHMRIYGIRGVHGMYGICAG